jgi:hypothetical protein
MNPANEGDAIFRIDKEEPGIYKVTFCNGETVTVNADNEEVAAHKACPQLYPLPNPID